jgi:hypothetical protein
VLFLPGLAVDHGAGNFISSGVAGITGIYHHTLLVLSASVLNCLFVELNCGVPICINIVHSHWYTFQKWCCMSEVNSIEQWLMGDTIRRCGTTSGCDAPHR